MPLELGTGDRAPPAQSGAWIQPIQIEALAFDVEAAMLMEVQPQALHRQGWDRGEDGEQAGVGSSAADVESDLVVANRRLDEVELRLERIERRLMELSALIARNLKAAFSAPIGPDGLGEGGPAPGQATPPGFAPQDEAGPPLIPAEPTRRNAGVGKARNRDLDQALETFLDSLAPQTRQ